MSGSFLTYDNVTAFYISTQKLQVGSKEISYIKDELTRDPLSLPTSKAVIDYIYPVKQKVQDILTVLSQEEDTVISRSKILGQKFKDTDNWEKSGFYFLDGTALLIPTAYTFTSPVYLKIPSHLFDRTGRYLIYLHIYTLKDCTFQIVDSNNIPVCSYTEPGKYYIELQERHIGQSPSVIIRVQNLVELSSVVISEIGLYYLSEKFHQYIESKISDLIGIDASTIVTENRLATVLQQYTMQYTDMANQLYTNIESHKTDYTNPHRVTYQQVGAAPAIHTHTLQELGAASAQHSHTLQELGAASAEHTHPEYVTTPVFSQTINTVYTDLKNRYKNIPKHTVVRSKIGKLPSTLESENINSLCQILIPSLYYHDSDNIYDEELGVINTNNTPIQGTVADIFQETSNYAYFQLDDVLTVTYTYHRPHKVIGYELKWDTQANRPTEIDVYKDGTTFLHKVIIDPHMTSITVTLNEPQLIESLTWVVQSVSTLSSVDYPDRYSLKIVFMFDDAPHDSIAVDLTDTILSVPDSGANFMLELPDTAFYTTTFQQHLLDVPVFIYADYNSVTRQVSVGHTYIQPEFSVVRKGVDISPLLVRSIATGTHTYTVPVIGTLEIITSDDQITQPLRVFEDSNFALTVQASQIQYRIRFNQPILLCGYSYNAPDNEGMPDEITLTQNITSSNVAVLDTMLYFNGSTIYNSYDNNYLYYKRIQPVTVSDITITFGINPPKTEFKLYRLKIYCSEDWYDINSNTMYHHNYPVARAYIGYAQYTEHAGKLGYAVTNTVCGTLTNYPVNELGICEEFGLYVVPNPYFTQDVTVNLRAYQPAMNTSSPAPYALVEEITDLYIYIRTYTQHRFIATIQRNW